MKKFPILWYENEDGLQYIPDLSASGTPDLPMGFEYQHSRFPSYLRHSVLRIENGRSRQLITYDDGYSPDVVLALLRPTCLEILVATIRYGSPGPRAESYDQAVIHAAIRCSRCINSLAHRLGLKWGYREGSEAWKKCNTSCELCEQPQGL